jgi:hypothetical protein
MTDYVSGRCQHCRKPYSQPLANLGTTHARAHCTPECAEADQEAQPSHEDTIRELWADLITEDGRLTLEGDETTDELRQALSYLHDAA